MSRTTPPRADLGWTLSALLSSYLKRAAEELAELPGGPRGYQVLAVAADGSCRNQAGIAEQLSVDRTVMTYLLDDLEQARLIKRQPDPNDRRSRQIVLTAKGTRTLADLSTRIAQVEADLLADLTPTESRQLRALLARAATTADADPGVSACSVAEAVAGAVTPASVRTS